MPIYFLMRERKKVGLDVRGGREKLGGIEGGETLTKIYCMKKIIFFNKRKML